jgi:hypothetical protein
VLGCNCHCFCEFLFSMLLHGQRIKVYLCYACPAELFAGLGDVMFCCGSVAVMFCYLTLLTPVVPVAVPADSSAPWGWREG